MHIEYLLFFIYFLFAFWIIPKIPFIRNVGFTRIEINSLLAIKILCGVLFAIYFERTFALGDYPSINEIGKIEYQLLLSNPKLFFSDFTADINKYGFAGLFESSNSFWGYLRFNALFKFVALLNLLTRGNFYFNSVIFSSLVFFGHIAFFRIFNSMYPGNKYKILFMCFFLPSVWLYTSCVHKDGFIFLAVAMMSFVFYKYLQNKTSVRFKHVMVFLAGLITIFLFRNYVIVALLPAMLTGLLCKLYPYKKKIVVGVSYGFYTLLFFMSGFTTGSFNLPAAVVKRKADFAAMEAGSTNISMNVLTPDFAGFLGNLPQALNHTLLRPYLWEFSSPGVLLTALELLCYQFIVIVFIFFRKKQGNIFNSFNLFGFAFFISMMLIIGYTIPNIGAIVRYRGMFWIFILCPMVCNTDWARLNFFRKKTV